MKTKIHPLDKKTQCKNKKNATSSVPQPPLAGRVLYLDLVGYRGACKFESTLKLLGATIERCFSKEVHGLITNRGKPEDYAQPKGQSKGSSPSPTTPSPFSFPSTRSALDSPQAASPGTLHNAPKPLTRGQAIAQKANLTRNYGSTAVLECAERYKIKIIHIDVAQKWVAKEYEKLPDSLKEQSKKEKDKKKHKVRRFTNNFIKLEAMNKHYRPMVKDFSVFPRVNLSSPQGTCPFLSGAKRDPDQLPEAEPEIAEKNRDKAGQRLLNTPETAESRAGTTASHSLSKSVSHKKTETRERCDSVESHNVLKTRARTAVKFKQMPPEKKTHKTGYCELCEVKYVDLVKHVKTEQHRAFVRNKSNYCSIDTMIAQGPNMEKFLRDVRKYSRVHMQEGLSERRSEDIVLVLSPWQKKKSSPRIQLQRCTTKDTSCSKGLYPPEAVSIPSKCSTNTAKRPSPLKATPPRRSPRFSSRVHSQSSGVHSGCEDHHKSRNNEVASPQGIKNTHHNDVKSPNSLRGSGPRKRIATSPGVSRKGRLSLRRRLVTRGETVPRADKSDTEENENAAVVIATEKVESTTPKSERNDKTVTSCTSKYTLKSNNCDPMKDNKVYCTSTRGRTNVSVDLEPQSMQKIDGHDLKPCVLLERLDLNKPVESGPVRKIYRSSRRNSSQKQNIKSHDPSPTDLLDANSRTDSLGISDKCCDVAVNELEYETSKKPSNDTENLGRLEKLVNTKDNAANVITTSVSDKNAVDCAESDQNKSETKIASDDMPPSNHTPSIAHVAEKDIEASTDCLKVASTDCLKSETVSLGEKSQIISELADICSKAEVKDVLAFPISVPVISAFDNDRIKVCVEESKRTDVTGDELSKEDSSMQEEKRTNFDNTVVHQCEMSKTSNKLENLDAHLQEESLKIRFQIQSKSENEENIKVEPDLLENLVKNSTNADMVLENKEIESLSSIFDSIENDSLAKEIKSLALTKSFQIIDERKSSTSGEVESIISTSVRIKSENEKSENISDDNYPKLASGFPAGFPLVSAEVVSLKKDLPKEENPDESKSTHSSLLRDIGEIVEMEANSSQKFDFTNIIKASPDFAKDSAAEDCFDLQTTMSHERLVPDNILKLDTSGSGSLKRKVKLKSNWRVMSDRSMMHMFLDEKSNESFNGFASDIMQDPGLIPTDLSYHDVSEIELEENSNFEWMMSEIEKAITTENTENYLLNELTNTNEVLNESFGPDRADEHTLEISRELEGDSPEKPQTPVASDMSDPKVNCRKQNERKDSSVTQETNVLDTFLGDYKVDLWAETPQTLKSKRHNLKAVASEPGYTKKRKKLDSKAKKSELCSVRGPVTNKNDEKKISRNISNSKKGLTDSNCGSVQSKLSNESHWTLESNPGGVKDIDNEIQFNFESPQRYKSEPSKKRNSYQPKSTAVKVLFENTAQSQFKNSSKDKVHTDQNSRELTDKQRLHCQKSEKFLSKSSGVPRLRHTEANSLQNNDSVELPKSSTIIKIKTKNAGCVDKKTPRSPKKKKLVGIASDNSDSISDKAKIFYSNINTPKSVDTISKDAKPATKSLLKHASSVQKSFTFNYLGGTRSKTFRVCSKKDLCNINKTEDLNTPKMVSPSYMESPACNISGQRKLSSSSTPADSVSRKRPAMECQRKLFHSQGKQTREGSDKQWSCLSQNETPGYVMESPLPTSAQKHKRARSASKTEDAFSAVCTRKLSTSSKAERGNVSPKPKKRLLSKLESDSPATNSPSKRNKSSKHKKWRTNSSTVVAKNLKEEDPFLFTCT